MDDNLLVQQTFQNGLVILVDILDPDSFSQLNSLVIKVKKSVLHIAN